MARLRLREVCLFVVVLGGLAMCGRLMIGGSYGGSSVNKDPRSVAIEMVVLEGDAGRMMVREALGGGAGGGDGVTLDAQAWSSLVASAEGSEGAMVARPAVLVQHRERATLTGPGVSMQCGVHVIDDGVARVALVLDDGERRLETAFTTASGGVAVTELGAMVLVRAVVLGEE